MLNLQNISKSYRGRHGAVQAVDNISLELQPQTVTVLRGPSGCGKTTLLLAAGGLLAPDKGTVSLDGESIYTLSQHSRAKLRAAKIGFVFQQFHLAPYLTVLDNIMVPTLTNSPSLRLNSRQRALNLVERFGLTNRLNHLPDELSTGERQRVALARAMINNPGLILADEPTGNLDEANAHGVLDALAEFAAAGGTVLIVSHDSRAANRYHRTIHMVNGKLTTEE